MLSQCSIGIGSDAVFLFCFLLWPAPLWNAWRLLVCAPWACLVMTQPSLTDPVSHSSSHKWVQHLPLLSLGSGLTILGTISPRQVGKTVLVSSLQLSTQQCTWHSRSLREGEGSSFGQFFEVCSFVSGAVENWLEWHGRMGKSLLV